MLMLFELSAGWPFLVLALIFSILPKKFYPLFVSTLLDVICIGAGDILRKRYSTGIIAALSCAVIHFFALLFASSLSSFGSSDTIQVMSAVFGLVIGIIMIFFLHDARVDERDEEKRRKMLQEMEESIKKINPYYVPSLSFSTSSSYSNYSNDDHDDFDILEQTMEYQQQMFREEHERQALEDLNMHNHHNHY
ncbi:hypothetical protein [Pseudobacillus wudalianchiensis]|uniref:Uncharacterized protein n=1 Tax=Pseudobacillus wudalianchiensis TaxID=1743143 RepID=A0A1B9BA41_9BACI|nr:hypothetical protein [Bacillus wudalianchiensis]OCA92943.1 hypothetical protein A8F95_04470 [Bacillus wudalianchiensis]